MHTTEILSVMSVSVENESFIDGYCRVWIDY